MLSIMGAGEEEETGGVVNGAAAWSASTYTILRE